MKQLQMREMHVQMTMTIKDRIRERISRLIKGQLEKWGSFPTGKMKFPSKLADANRRQFEGHTDMIANIASNVLAMQDVINKNGKGQHREQRPEQPDTSNEVDMRVENDDNHEISDDNVLEDVSDEDELDIDDVVDGKEIAESDTFFEELEKMYEDQKKFGDKTDEQMAKLVHQAIDKASSAEKLKKLKEQYLIPE